MFLHEAGCPKEADPRNETCSCPFRKGEKLLYTFPAGVRRFGYHEEEYNIELFVTVVREVEGWYEVCFKDLSTCIVRPSRLSRIKEDG